MEALERIEQILKQCEGIGPEHDCFYFLHEQLTLWTAELKEEKRKCDEWKASSEVYQAMKSFTNDKPLTQMQQKISNYAWGDGTKNERMNFREKIIKAHNVDLDTMTKEEADRIWEYYGQAPTEIDYNPQSANFYRLIK